MNIAKIIIFKFVFKGKNIFMQLDPVPISHALSFLIWDRHEFISITVECCQLGGTNLLKPIKLLRWIEFIHYVNSTIALLIRD